MVAFLFVQVLCQLAIGDPSKAISESISLRQRQSADRSEKEGELNGALRTPRRPVLVELGVSLTWSFLLQATRLLQSLLHRRPLHPVDALPHGIL
jgi:hypothetical protein